MSDDKLPYNLARLIHINDWEIFTWLGKVSNTVVIKSKSDKSDFHMFHMKTENEEKLKDRLKTYQRKAKIKTMFEGV